MKPVPEFDTKALEKLLNHHYPGNVRELQYIIERAVIMTDDDVLEQKTLSSLLLKLPLQPKQNPRNKIERSRKEYDP
jgi:DNA-binding NtrC family response regulator